MGGGQPADVYDVFSNRKARSRGLYQADEGSSLKNSQENSQAQEIYVTLIKGRAHTLLHRNLHE